MLNKQLGATLLVAGTSIGAGMLVLPISMNSLGFLGSFTVMIALWSAMLLSALFMLEVNLSLPVGTNFLSMAEKTFGLPGKVLVCLFYLGLLYSLNAAYLDSLVAFLKIYFTNYYLIGIVFLSLFMVLILLGTSLVDRLNRFLVIILLGSYLFVVFGLMQKLSLDNLLKFSFDNTFKSLPIVITAFGFQIVIPTVRRYCEGDIKIMIKSICHGGLLSLLVYLIWQFGVLGKISSSDLDIIYQAKDPVVFLSKELFYHLSYYSHALEIFTIFAIATSFLGVSISLFDFFIDALKAYRHGWTATFVLVLIFMPSLLVLFYFPHVFIQALSYSGICVVFLLGVFPVLMAYKVRFTHQVTAWQVPYGKVLMLWVIFVMTAVLSGI